MQKFISVVLFSMIMACGGDNELPPYTWGDASLAVTTSWCSAEQRCFNFTDEDTAKCERHLFFHLCELTDTCDVKLPVEALTAVNQCTAKVDEAGDTDPDACWVVSFGITPLACDDFWAYQPKDEDTARTWSGDGWAPDDEYGQNLIKIWEDANE